MRDKRFVAVHRGGLLTKDNHHKLITEAKPILTFDDDAPEEFKNLYSWFELAQWYHPWGEFDYKTMEFVILPSNWPIW